MGIQMDEKYTIVTDQQPSSDMECYDQVDKAFFEQILELDDDRRKCDFSRPLVGDFFKQALTTLSSMETARASGNMQELNDLCILLLSSSMAMGFTRLEHHYRAIQKSVSHLTLIKPEPPYAQNSMYRIAEALVATNACVAELQLQMERFFTWRQMEE